MNKGSLIYNDYLNLIGKKMILTNSLNLSQIQPSSIDLTLSNECYQIEASFLSPNNKSPEKPFVNSNFPVFLKCCNIEYI